MNLDPYFAPLIYGMGGLSFLGEIASVLVYQRAGLAPARRLVGLLRSAGGSPEFLKASYSDQEWLDLLGHVQGKEGSGKLKAEQSGDRYLLTKQPAALASAAPASPLKVTPALLTALGVFGTFYGVNASLKATKLDNIQSAEQMMSISKQILGGMATAFETSLQGVSCAILMMITLALGAWLRGVFRDKLRAQLALVATKRSALEILSAMDPEASARSAQQMSDAAQNLERGIERLTKAQESMTPEAIGQQVGVAVGGIMKDELAPIFQAIREELAVLSKIKADQGEEVLKKLIESLRVEVLEPIADRLDQSAATTQQAAEAVDQLRRELGGISKELAEAVTTIERFQIQTLERMEAFASSLSDTLVQFRESTHQVLKDVAAEIQRAVDGGIQGMEAQREAFQASAEDAAATFRGIREDLSTALEEQAQREKVMLDGVRKSTVAILERAQSVFEQQSGTLEAVGREASQLMTQARDNLVESLENVNQMLQDTRIMVQEELEKFRIAYQASLESFFQEQNQLLEETLGKQREGLARVVADLQNVFNEEVAKRKDLVNLVNQSLDRMDQSSKITRELLDSASLAIGSAGGNLEELARVLSDEVTRVDTLYRQLSTELAKTLSDSQSALSQYLNQAQSTQETYFQEMDKASAAIAQRLLDAATWLADAEQQRRLPRS